MTSIKIPSTAVELRTVSARSAIALNGWPAIAFGTVFVAAGSGTAGRVLFGDTAGLHAPRGVGIVVGIVFVLAGMFVAVNGFMDLGRKQDAAERAAATPDQPWWWDYEWQREGIGNDTNREIAKAFGFAIFLELFLTPFHWIGFFSRERPWIFGVSALLFDCAAVALVVRGIRLLLMRRRYGRSWLRFARFPFRPGERLEVTLDASAHLAQVPALTATLHCVQERYETRGTGRNRSQQVICYSIWSATMPVPQSTKRTFDVAFEIPADARSSALSERPARFWELVLRSDDVPGVDYSASFLVPVYAARR